MKKELMTEAYKQISIFLEACMTPNERAEFLQDESLTNLRILFDDKTFNKELDDYKKDFEKKLIDITEITQQYQEAEKTNLAAYQEFIQNIKEYIVLYYKTVKSE